jgi:hypothetical protein
MNIFFKNIDTFNSKEFNFTLDFSNNVWMYRKVSKNEFWFINKVNNQALILNVFNDNFYTHDLLKLESNKLSKLVKIGDYESFLICKNFKLHSTLQYEWIFVDSGVKFKFSYPIMDEKSEIEKDKDFEEALSILNTIKKKFVK